MTPEEIATTQLSPHFALREFLYSETAERRGLAIIPDEDIVANLRRLCTDLLEPIRVQIGMPLVINSGYRPLWLNELIGGSKTSAHRFGCAADIRVVGMTPLQFCRWIVARPFVFDQCIYEGTWTHLGIRWDDAPPRGQVLTARFDSAGVHYSVGLPR